MLARLGVVAVLALTLGAPSPASAQQTTARAAAITAGPRMDATATAMRHRATANSMSVAAAKNNVGKPVAMMIVGGAAILLGAVIGDDAGTLFMIGGAIALLYGLYLYLQ